MSTRARPRSDAGGRNSEHTRRMSPVRPLKAFISSAQPIALIGCLVIDEFKFLQLTFDLTVERLQNGVCPEQVRKQRNGVFFLQVQGCTAKDCCLLQTLLKRQQRR